MEASIQTERRRKPELTPIVTAGLPQVQEEDEKEKERRIKKLTLINRQLIETLKRQNEQLTRKINKQKLKVGKSVERIESPTRNLQKQKTELANAYKQIQMYKTVLKDMKAKEISTESTDKLNQLQNKIKYEDMTIEKLQKELKYIKNIKDLQQRQLHLYQNNDVKKSVGELEEQLKQLKQKLKQAKKLAKKREQLGMKQHSYFMQLEKTLRKHNDEYYPGVTNNKSSKKEQTAADTEEITERQWQIVRAQLTELKKTHQQNNKKIQQLTRLRNKEVKSCEQNQIKLKQRMRKLQSLRSKIGELVKLTGSTKQDEQKKKNNEPIDQESEYQGVLQNGKKQFKSKDPNNDRQVKKWMIPLGYVQEKGKILPDSAFYSDKTELRQTKKSKIIKIQVWHDTSGVPALCQFHYKSGQNRIIEGIIPYTLNQLSQFQDKTIQFKEGDYLAKIQGKFNNGFLTSLIFVSKFGKRQEFNGDGSGEDFKFEPRPNQIPTCMFGATVKDEQDRIFTCYLGCQFISDW